MKSTKIALLIMLLHGFAGCQLLTDSSNKLNDLLALGAASASIKQSSGGIIQAPTMSLIVPQGALEEDTVITFRSTALPDPTDAIVPVQAAYEFGPADLQFNKPASLEICYDPNVVRDQGLDEQTMQIQYHDPDTGEFVSMGGDVDTVHHCVTSSIYHFSTYILTAQLLAAGNNPPTIGGASFFPGTPLAGLPLTVRSSIQDWDGGSAIATVRFFYRSTGSGSPFKSIAMLPEANDPTGQFYTAKVPATDVSAAGLEYYIQAFDSLNAGRTSPATAPTTFNTIVGDNPHPTTPIRFQTNITRLSAGFSRDLTVQVRGASAATYFPVPAETLTFTGNKGTTSRPTWLSARYTAQIIGASSLDASYGFLNVSIPINVYPGPLNRIAVLYNDAELPDPGPFVVDALTVTQFDAVGYDAYENFMFVQPVFTATPAIGTFGGPGNYGQFTAANVFPDTAGTITASVGGYSISYNMLVLFITFPPCLYDTGTFDTASCVFN